MGDGRQERVYHCGESNVSGPDFSREQKPKWWKIMEHTLVTESAARKTPSPPLPYQDNSKAHEIHRSHCVNQVTVEGRPLLTRV
jgi:hypothetical protein